MSPLPKALPRYHQCRYSLFVSYALADDRGNNRFVTTLRDAIRDRLDELPKEISRNALHFSGEDPLAVGHLGFELQARVQESFGMLLVVGNHYAESGWCERELDFFAEYFGEAATATRLFIAVLSPKALERVSQGATWQRIVDRDQLWSPMFQADNPDRLIRTHIDEKRYTQEFFDRVRGIADPLIKQIEGDWPRKEPGHDKGSKPSSTAGRESPEAKNTPHATPWTAEASRPCVAIGPFRSDFDDHLEPLCRALSQAGARVKTLERGLFADYDYESEGVFESTLAPFDALIVPIARQRLPLVPGVDGGHATVLEREWSRLRKGQGIIWYEPHDVVANLEGQPLDEHGPILAALNPVCQSPTAVVNLLFGVDPGNTVRLYIESNRDHGSDAYELLAERIGEAWDGLSVGTDRPAIKCMTLDLAALGSAPSDDIEGVVLLMPMSTKGPLKLETTLRSQMTEVQKAIKKGGAVYPGCIALLFRPEPPRPGVSQHEWRHIQFESEVPKRLLLDADSRPNLDAFLMNIWRRHSRSAAARQRPIPPDAIPGVVP